MEYEDVIAALKDRGGKTPEEHLAALIAAGEAEAPRRSVRTVPRPIRLPGGATISDLVSEQRR